MSISINGYGSSYNLTQSDSTNTVESHHHSHRHSSRSTASEEQGTSTDTVQFSQQSMEYLIGYQNPNPVSTGNYGPNSSEPELTTDQKKAILADMQNRLSTLSSSSSGIPVSGNATNPFSTIKDELSGFDSSNATDEQISDLFDEVTQTAEQALPPFGQ